MMTQTICYIEGDGVVPEVTAVMLKAVDAAVGKAYQGAKRIEWKEVLAGQKAFDRVGTTRPRRPLKRSGSTGRS